MARAQRAPRASTTNPASNGAGAQGNLPDTTTTAPKKTKARRSDDEIEADLKQKLAAVRARRRLAAIGDNKPLLAAFKAAQRLSKWLSANANAIIDAELGQHLVGAKAPPEDLGAESDPGSAAEGGEPEGDQPDLNYR